MKNSRPAFVGTLTIGAKLIILRIDTDPGYVWDGIFEDARERFGYESLPDGPTRAALKKAAQRIGYSVRRGIVQFD